MKIEKIYKTQIDKSKVMTDKNESDINTYSCNYINNLPTGGSDIIYDGEEKIIGTWFGKPLYRKVYNLQNGLANGGNFEIENGSVIETYTRIEGILKFNDTGYVQIPYSLGSNDYSGIYVQGTKLYYKTVSYANKPLKITLEYTKTTD